jgi:hopanoid-associated phosphorylase
MLRPFCTECKNMLGILCGLEDEAKIARKIKGAIVACAAARPGKARELAQGLVDQGAKRLMSFGIAGALESSVVLGDLFIGSGITSAKGKWACNDAWAVALADKMPQAKRGGVYGSETLVATVGDKAALHSGSGCVIVDMESQCLAEVAFAANLPMIVVRAVCDDATMNVPPLVMAAIAEDGSIDIVRALAHLARNPSQLPDLFHVMRGTGKALRALRKAREAI